VAEMLPSLVSLASRVLFVASFLMAALAALEKVANLMGLTLLRGAYTPWRLLEFSVVGVLFVIALQLRELKSSLRSPGGR
jgi:hypothetical protein